MAFVGFVGKQALGNFMGFRVVVDHNIKPLPKLKISDDFEWVTDEFRRETNAMYLERFGEYEPSYLVNNETYIVSPRAYKALQEQSI